jgi:hypothetical protein
LEGQIVDRGGKPVAGAKVTRADSTARHETVTDATGRFKFDFVIDRAGFLFVDAAGFRFHGQINDSSKPLHVTLARADEAPLTSLRTLAPKVSKEERRAMADKLLAPQRERALAKGKDDDRLRSLENLAQTDPGRVLEEIEKKPFANPWYDDYLRRAVVKRVLHDSLEEARTIADAMRDPGFRVTAYLDLYAAIPAGAKAEQRKLLADALVHARSIPAADHRVIYLGQVAEKLLALGDKETASKILREGEEAAKQLPTSAWAGYARGAFAESLAMLDTGAALEMIKELKDPREFDRHHGNMAVMLAATNPAEAERVLGMVREDWQRGQYAQRVCYHMVAVDPKRARYLGEQIKHVFHKAYTQGLMAKALAKSDPQQAKELLADAYALLDGQAAKGEEDFNNFVGSSSLAAMLVPVAEEIDSASAAEFFWRAVSFRVPHVRDARLESFDTQNPMGWMADASLAEAAARYDRAVAELLIEQAAPALLAAKSSNHLFEAAALTDPALALRLLEQLPEDGKKDYFREKIAIRLMRDGDALWRVVHRDLGLWWVEDDDR